MMQKLQVQLLYLGTEVKWQYNISNQFEEKPHGNSKVKYTVCRAIGMKNSG